MKKTILSSVLPTLVLALLHLTPNAQPATPETAYEELLARIDVKADAIEEQVIAWRRHFHQYPELSNREFETAKYIEAFLRTLPMEVRTGIAHTGVVGILQGGRPGPVIALRADMDALPVTERVDLPFASRARAEYLGQETGVMHACGHDTHMAMLMGAANILSEIRDEIAGTIVFIFQPAEEGAPPGEEGGAKLMVAEGVLDDPKVDVIFGLHIASSIPVGSLSYKPYGMLAAADILNISVHGKQTHGSTPWTGVDPIVVAAQIIMGLQTIVSRQTELTKEAAVITIGIIRGGVRNNIIPEKVEMIGTIRTLDVDMQRVIHEKIHRTVQGIASSAGARADVNIVTGVPVTYNDPDLVRAFVPTLYRVAGEDNVHLQRAITGAEDFSFYALKVPGFFIRVGGLSPGMDPADAAPHHTPDFYIDESGMKLGVRTLCNLAVDYGRTIE